MATFTEAYRQAEYTITNPRNQWSARKSDGSGVALTVWQDEIDKTTEPWVVDTRKHPRFADWGGRAGNSIRRKDIAHALEMCDGEVDFILCVAQNPQEQPRKIKIARHWPQRKGRLVSAAFDPQTGVFLLELHQNTG